MADRDWLAEQFEANRPRLQALVYHMLGSPSEADDAVQESWLRISRSAAAGVENLSACSRRHTARHNCPCGSWVTASG
jgi:RNA polymerase sigma-70 factor (ECF subfamily)